MGTDRNGTVTVGGSGIDLGASLPDRVRSDVTALSGKFFDRLVAASAHFSREADGLKCRLNLRIGGLGPITAEAMDRDPYAAFSSARGKAAKQMRRLKRRIVAGRSSARA